MRVNELTAALDIQTEEEAQVGTHYMYMIAGYKGLAHYQVNKTFTV
jgi:hypothetical protein